jgi:4-hydroxy-tetrahydrodipicolinate synthase
MASPLDLHGILVPLVTPFAADGSVAYDEVRRLATEYLDAGARGIVALGTTGEPATLTDDEKGRVVAEVAAVCRARDAQLLVGAGTNATAASIDQVRKMGGVEGVDGLLVATPYYTRPSDDGIVAHFRALAEASPVPVVLYNVPHRTGRAMGARVILELAGVDNIAGLKQAVSGIDEATAEVLVGVPEGFDVLCGDDPFIFAMQCLGGRGAIAASAHVCTPVFVEMVESAAKGEIARARELSGALLPVCQALFAEPSPGVTKGVLAAMGRISTPDLRLPMTLATSAAVERALGAIERAEQVASR